MGKDNVNSWLIMIDLMKLFWSNVIFIGWFLLWISVYYLFYIKKSYTQMCFDLQNLHFNRNWIIYEFKHKMLNNNTLFSLPFFQLIGFTSSCVSISAFNEEEESCKYLAYSSTYTRPGSIRRSHSAQSYPSLYVRDSWSLPTYISHSEGLDGFRNTQATPRMSQTSQLLIAPSDDEV